MSVPLPGRWDVLVRKLIQEPDHDRLSVLVAGFRMGHRLPNEPGNRRCSPRRLSEQMSRLWRL
jgi:hypothetical protein